MILSAKSVSLSASWLRCLALAILAAVALVTASSPSAAKPLSTAPESASAVAGPPAAAAGRPSTAKSPSTVTGPPSGTAKPRPARRESAGAGESSPGEAPYIRHIVFEQLPIFTEKDRRRFSWLPLSWVNALHIDTRKGTLRQELLVEEGDRADPQLLDESERKLRATGILVDVRLETQHVAPDSVDLYVHTREVWTTTFELSFESFEGTQLLSFRAGEKNFLGTGREFSVARDEELDRTTWAFGLRDRHAFDHRWDLGLDYRDATDGNSFGWHLDRPFHRLESNWAWIGNYRHAGGSPRYYLGGPYYARPHGDLSSAFFQLRRRVGNWGEGVVRAGAGIRVADQRFNPVKGATVYEAAGPTSKLVDLDGNYPENRQVRGPVVSLQRVPLHYKHRRFLDQMGRQEDLATGQDLSLSLQWITPLLDSSFDGAWFRARDRWTIVSDKTVTRLGARAEGHLGQGENPNVKASLQARFNYDCCEAFSLAASLLGETGSNIDRNRIYTLGIDNGLRSARAQEYPGDRLLRGNFELRWVYRKGVVDLVTPGITAFADFGSAWFEDEGDFVWSNVRGALGIGLRLGMNRSAMNAPLRVDFAWPLFYSTERSAPVVSIGTGHAF